MKWAAVIAGALVLAAPAFAGSSLKVPAPTVGKVRVELVTIKASKTPTLKVGNLSALGKGFGGVAAVGKSKTGGTYVAYLVMYMGNLSTSPASTVSLQITGGTPAGKPTDETGNCKVLKSLYDGNYSGLQTASFLFEHFEVGGSPAKTELKNDLSFQLQQAGCK